MLEEYKELIENWYDSNDKRIFIISGYAGCGKTTLARKIPKMLEINNVAFLTPTGIAAKVLGSGAQTIHSFLYFTKKDPVTGELRFTKRPVFEFGQELLIIDEISMVGEDILEDLKSLNIKMIGIGDPQQLPPVNGRSDILNKPDIFLTKVWRNDGGLLQLATDIRSGEPIKTEYNNVEFRKSVFFDLKLYDDDSIIICRKNKTRQAINKIIRERVYKYKSDIVVGERIMILQNDRESGLSNGSIVTISAVHSVSYTNRTATISVRDALGITYRLQVYLYALYNESIPEKVVRQDKQNPKLSIDYAYAITCHKSQGSEFKNVFVVREGMMFDDWDKWYYTAVTRAREKLYIY